MSPSLQADLAALAYLVSGVLFIQALRGLSSPASSRTGNRNGMIGMAIAVATTLWVSGVTDPLTWGLIVGGIVIGGGIGAVTARRIAMTDMRSLSRFSIRLSVSPPCWSLAPRSTRRKHSASAPKVRFGRRA